MRPGLVSTSPTGARMLPAPLHADERGVFCKPFAAARIATQVSGFTAAEVFWSRSEAGVVRGLHYQRPPSAVAKIVFVVQGRVRDVVLDLRSDSPTFGVCDVVELDESSGAFFIPRGFAHGFEVVTGPATMCYLQDGPFDPVTDTGIRWDSVGVEWTTPDPILSQRDHDLPVWTERAGRPSSEWTHRG